MLTMFNLTRVGVAGSTTANFATTLLFLGLIFGRALSAPLNPNIPAHGVIPNRGCVTSVSEEDKRDMEAGLLEARASMPWGDDVEDLERREVKASGGRGPLRKVVFDVFMHILYVNETVEGGYVPDSQITEQIAVLNSAYASANISYNLVNVTLIENPDWFVNAWPGSPQELEMKTMYHKGNSSALNVFTAGFNATDRSLGYASLPSSYLREPLKDGLMIRYSTLPGGSHTNYNHGNTMVHEIGHWLGLYHTFEGGCTGVGDNVADTPPEASGAEGCPVGRKSCGANATLPDPIHNFMDYSFDSCMTHFTPGQAVRMHEAIWAFRTQRPPVANSTVTSTTTATGSSPTSTSTSTPSPSVGQESSEGGQDASDEGGEEELGDGGDAEENVAGEEVDDEAPLN